MKNNMEAGNNKVIVETTVNATRETVWKYWTEPEHIKRWNAASDDWHTTAAENDLRTGGKFSSRMEAKDGSFGFDFGGIYDEVKLLEFISYTLGDGRKVEINFEDENKEGKGTKITEIFDAETTNSLDMQKQGWQAILNNFKKYAEQI